MRTAIAGLMLAASVVIPPTGSTQHCPPPPFAKLIPIYSWLAHPQLCGPKSAKLPVHHG